MSGEAGKSRWIERSEARGHENGPLAMTMNLLGAKEGSGLLGAKAEEQRQTLSSVRIKGRMNPLGQKGL